MPLELAYIPDGCDEETAHYLIEPAEGIMLSNKIDGREQLLSIGCNNIDNGGEVKILPTEGPLADIEEGFIPLDEMPEPLQVIPIDIEKPYNLPFTDPSGRRGTLIVRHVGGGAITASGLIPRSLFYPN